MELYLSFELFWKEYHEKTVQERRIYMESLSSEQTSELVKSFFEDGWARLISQNIVDKRLRYIKKKFNIDLIEMRIDALYLGKVFLIEKTTWEKIEDMVLEFEDYYDTDLVFGGLVVSVWGRNNQFCKIRATRRF